MRFSWEKTYPVIKAIFVLLVLVSAFCAGFHTVADYDMGWQLATGRYVVEHHQIPRTDVLSLTSIGKPWTYPPFAGVLFYLIYSGFGYAGLTWFCALACAVVVAYLLRKGDIGSATLAMFAVQSIAARISPRADLFTTLFFAFFLGELWDYYRGVRSRLWLLPVIMLLWVNLHPGFIAGLAAIGAYLFVEILDLAFVERRGAALQRLRRAWPWFAACGGVTLLNPWGPRIYLSSLRLSGLMAPSTGKLNSGSFIGEFKSVPISTHLVSQLFDLRHMENGFSWLLLLAVVVAALFLWRRQFGAALLALAALYAGIAHARYMALFAITIVILSGPFLSDLFASGSPSQSEKSSRPLFRIPQPLALFAVLALCGVACLHIADYVSNRTYIVFGADWRFGAGESSWFPDQASSFILREEPPGNIFEEYALGGYAAWRLGPKYLDFIDGRGDRLSPDLVIEQRKLYSEAPDSPAWKTAADRWNLNVLLFATSSFRGLQKLDPLAFCESSAWRPVYMDAVSLVFLRDTPQNRPWIDRLQINCKIQRLTTPDSVSRSTLYDFYLNSGALFLELQRDHEAEQSLREASALYPEDPNAHLLLAALFQRQQRPSDAEREYLTSLALNESGGALYSLGILYANEGRTTEAIKAIERAARLSVDPLQMYMTLGQFQNALNHPVEALAAYSKAEDSSPYRNGGESLAPELYAELAEGRSESYRLMGQWSEAIALQREAIRHTPLVASRWNRLAALYEATGQMQPAAEARQRAVELEANNPSH